MTHFRIRTPLTRRALGAAALTGLIVLSATVTAFAQPAWQAEWKSVQAAARKEGKVVVGVPPDAALRRELEKVMKDKFGIEIELVLALGGKTTRRIVDEYNAGVHYFDVAILSMEEVGPALRPIGAVEDLHKYWILPEVRDPKYWWGGHIWGDKEHKYVYHMAAYMLDNIWHNADLAKADEVKSWDDLLNPKWKGKIGLFDPRLGGAGRGIWGFIWEAKGESYLTKLAAQKLVLGDRRPLADQLARGKLAITVGPTFYSFQPFVKAGLPVKPFPTQREGTYVSVGNGGSVVMKNPPHPNAAKVFVNWFLSHDGQETWSRIHGQATRRLDVDTKWMPKIGVRAAKDNISVQDFLKRENQSEVRSQAVRVPALKFAHKLFD